MRFAKREHYSLCIWMLKRSLEDFSPHIVFVTGFIHKWQFATPFEIPFGPEPLMDIPPPSLAQKFLVIPTFASKNVGWFYLPWGRSIFPCLSETWVMGQNRGSKSQVYWAARHGLNSRFVLRSWLWCPFVVLTGGGGPYLIFPFPPPLNPSPNEVPSLLPKGHNHHLFNFGEGPHKGAVFATFWLLVTGKRRKRQDLD